MCTDMWHQIFQALCFIDYKMHPVFRVVKDEHYVHFRIDEITWEQRSITAAWLAQHNQKGHFCKHVGCLHHIFQDLSLHYYNHPLGSADLVTFPVSSLCHSIELCYLGQICICPHSPFSPALRNRSLASLAWT